VYGSLPKAFPVKLEAAVKVPAASIYSLGLFYPHL
jgi:hypothetical protein